MPEYGKFRLIIERVDEPTHHAQARESNFGAVLVDVVIHGQRPGMKVFDLRSLGLSPDHQIEKDYQARLFASYRLLPHQRGDGLESIDPHSLQTIADRISERLFPSLSPWLNAANAATNAGRLAILLDVDPILGDLPWELVKLPGLTLRPTVIRSVGSPLWRRQAQNTQAPDDPVLLALMCGEVEGFDGLADVIEEERANLAVAFDRLLRIEHFSDYESFTLALGKRDLLNRAIGLHFLGHGHVDEHGPFLACPKSRTSRKLQKLRPDTLLPLLSKRATPLSWVFLGACYAGSDAVSLRAYPSGGFAASLVKHGVTNSALAMRFEVTPRFALDFSRYFYNDLTQAQGPDVETAYDAARAGLLAEAEFEAELSAVSLFVNDTAEKTQIRWPPRADAVVVPRPVVPAVPTSSSPPSAPRRDRPDQGTVETAVRRLMTTRQWDQTEADRLTAALDDLRQGATQADQDAARKALAGRLRMVRVPAGTYELGYTAGQIDRVCAGLHGKFSPAVIDQTRETMQGVRLRSVTTAGFLVDRFLVTFDEFRRFVDATRYVTSAERLRSRTTWRSFPEEQAPDFPVVAVSHNDAEEYARWVGKRLLAADEWQILVRNGDGRIYPWGFDYSESKCNTGENVGVSNLNPVTYFGAGVSEHGCYDLVGNAEDWTSTRTEDGAAYRVCGGSWRMTCEIYGIPGFSRRAAVDTFTDDLGFRCAIDDAVSR